MQIIAVQTSTTGLPTASHVIIENANYRVPNVEKEYKK